MRLTAEIDRETHALDLRREDDLVVAELDGHRYELVLREPEAGIYLLIAGAQVYECRVEPDAAERTLVHVYVGNRTYDITLIDPKRLRAAQSAGAHADGAAQVVAPMPGKVVRVLVEQGTQVEAGDGLVVVEAMKMQNEMKSPRAGRISEVRASAGTTVNAGDVLIVIE